MDSVLLFWQLDQFPEMYINNLDSKSVVFPGRLLMENEVFYLAKLWRKHISFGRLITPKKSEPIYKERIGANITYDYCCNAFSLSLWFNALSNLRIIFLSIHMWL